jgi:hypothetical protein
MRQKMRGIYHYQTLNHLLHDVISKESYSKQNIALIKSRNIDEIPGRYKTQVAGCRLEFCRLGILQVVILQIRDFAGWNFAGWGFCRLEFCRLPGTLQVDNANLKLHHFFSILVKFSCAFIVV